MPLCTIFDDLPQLYLHSRQFSLLHSDTSEEESLKLVSCLPLHYIGSSLIFAVYTLDMIFILIGN